MIDGGKDKFLPTCYNICGLVGTLGKENDWPVKEERYRNKKN